MDFNILPTLDPRVVSEVAHKIVYFACVYSVNTLEHSRSFLCKDPKFVAFM